MDCLNIAPSFVQLIDARPQERCDVHQGALSVVQQTNHPQGSFHLLFVTLSTTCVVQHKAK
jgi:hypothetical protein